MTQFVISIIQVVFLLGAVLAFGFLGGQSFAGAHHGWAAVWLICGMVVGLAIWTSLPSPQGEEMAAELDVGKRELKE